MPAIRDPIQEQRFGQHFSTTGMTGDECRDWAEGVMIDLRRLASLVAAEWLVKRNHFNGELENHLHYDAENEVCRVVVVLRDFGLPYAEEDDDPSALTQETPC